MIKAIIFDADGVVTSSKMFSTELEKEFGIPAKKLLPFFEKDFQPCVVGKADLKEELTKHIGEWGWKGSVDELVDFWFTAENEVHEPVLAKVKELRTRGIPCYMATNQEKYRAEYLRECMGFGESFDGFFSSAELKEKKPSQEFFQIVYDRISDNGNIAKDEIMFWDDDQENVDGAKKFGIDAHFYQDFDEFEKIVDEATGLVA